MTAPPKPLRTNLRAEWMLDDRITFLNHGSFGAVPRRVFDAQTRWRQRIEAEPVELLGRGAQSLIADAKLPVASWLGMRPDDFGFVTNATEGINAVLRSLELAPGDELLTTTHVYNAVRQSMKEIAHRARAVYREIELPLPLHSGNEAREIVLASLNSQTRLLVIDHITSPTALVFPVKDIVAGCADRGVQVLVDGAHAPGMLDLNVSAIGSAYYAGNLHKWTCAPKGSGFVHIRSDVSPPVHPLVISHEYGEGIAREFAWQGTRDISAWLTVPTALEFMSELGWDSIRSYNHDLAIHVQQMLCKRWKVEPLSPLDGCLIGCMATVPLPGSLATLSTAQCLQLQQTLYQVHHIEVPVVPWDGRTFVRPCCQVYNTIEEYERLASVIELLAS